MYVPKGALLEGNTMKLGGAKPVAQGRTDFCRPTPHGLEGAIEALGTVAPMRPGEVLSVRDFFNYYLSGLAWLLLATVAIVPLRDPTNAELGHAKAVADSIGVPLGACAYRTAQFCYRENAFRLRRRSSTVTCPCGTGRAHTWRRHETTG
jgi:hypothetical protein